MVIIDTDVLIWMLRDDEGIKARFRRVVIETDGALFVSPVQIAEIYAGVRPKERAKTDNFMNTLSVLSIERETGKHAGEYMLAYAKSHKITLADALIAALVRKTGFKLWTLNKKHYPMVENEDIF